MFIEAISKKTNLTKGEATIVNSVLEDNFFLSKKSKDKIVASIQNDINVSYDRALEIYEICIDIVKENIKFKLKHPFKNLDK